MCRCENRRESLREAREAPAPGPCAREGGATRRARIGAREACEDCLIPRIRRRGCEEGQEYVVYRNTYSRAAARSSRRRRRRDAAVGRGGGEFEGRERRGEEGKSERLPPRAGARGSRREQMEGWRPGEITVWCRRRGREWRIWAARLRATELVWSVEGQRKHGCGGTKREGMWKDKSGRGTGRVRDQEQCVSRRC
jgi:hypothetical protein